MPEIKNIPVNLKNPVGFFSEYHQSNLYLSLSGFFSVQINNMELFPKKKIVSDLITADFISALQSALTLLAKDNNIYNLLADPTVFNTISAYMQVCLEEWKNDYGFELISVSPNKVAFDNESLTVIQIADSMKNNTSVIPQNNNAVPVINRENIWECPQCHCINDSNFCKDCGIPKVTSWKCVCGTENTMNFCKECGTPKDAVWQCSCGSLNKSKFCPKCGHPKNY